MLTAGGLFDGTGVGVGVGMGVGIGAGYRMASWFVDAFDQRPGRGGGVRG